jgi:chloramphenicol 3-O-phosphotransferase
MGRPLTSDSLLLQLLAGLRSGSVTHLFTDPTSEAAARAVLEPLAEAPDLVVSWSGVNRQRVDAVVTSSSGEWRIVYFVSDSGRIGPVHLYEKPAPFEGLPRGGLAVVVNGPSGSGKSTLMRAVLDAAEEPWVIFDEPPIGTVSQPYLIWPEAAPTLHRGFFRAIAALAAEGNYVALSAAGFPFELVRDLFASGPAIFVGLDCPLDVLLQREDGRTGRWGGLAESSLSVHEGWRYDLRFDTSLESPSAMARGVLELVASRA